MRFHFFTIPAADLGPATEALNAFCAAHTVLGVERRFIAAGEGGYWSVSLTVAADSHASNKRGGGKVDYRESLPADQFALYARLRTQRKALADERGIPAYQVFTNDQLAAMVQRRLTSREQLATIDGVGEGRLDAYAEAMLEILSGPDGVVTLEGVDAPAK